MNKKYYIKISELPVINSRSQQEFDNIILEYIEKFKAIIPNREIITHLIATSIDYPYEYVKETIEAYIRSKLLTRDLQRIQNNEAFVRETIFINGYQTLHFMYDQHTEKLIEIEQTDILEFESKIIQKETDLDDLDYLNIYRSIFYNDNFFKNETKENDKYLMALTIKKIEKKQYKEFLKDKIEVFEISQISKEQIDKINNSDKNKIKNAIKQYLRNYDYDFLKEINKNGYYQYNLANNAKKDSYSCDQTIENLLNIAEKSIFIITNKIDEGATTKAYEKFDEIRQNKNIYIRTIEGFLDDEQPKCIVNQEKEYYVQQFNKKSHSKILIIDDLFVAMGSGNWFSSSRTFSEDSLVIFPCNQAISKYNPIYFPKGDYYNIFEQLVNNSTELEDLFNLYFTMKKDLAYDIENTKNIFDELLIKKLEISMEKNIRKKIEEIEKFLSYESQNNKEFIPYLLSSDNIEEQYKNRIRTLKTGGE